MITFSELGCLGRLGNQLFQYAAIRSLSLDKGFELGIPNPKTMHWHGQDCLLDNFNIEASYIPENYEPQYTYTETNSFKLDKNFFHLGDGLDIKGYFQSIAYFEKHIDQIKKELSPKQHFLDSAKKEIDAYREKYNCEIVSIHVRRGDNTDYTIPDQVELNNFYCAPGAPRLSPSSRYAYYINTAMSKFENVKFLIFSGGGRNGNNNISDMEWCKNSFVGDQFIFSENKTVMEDFSLIMNCDHNILSHVSSFGWWAAFLNENSKTTIAPLNYHPDKPDYTHRYKFYPDDWILI
jgi:hypothetical protein|tara:strand:- start:35822 stop:36700 length:879 start_codon:yes stop_codon:yes gene_type:complete